MEITNGLGKPYRTRFDIVEGHNNNGNSYINDSDDESSRSDSDENSINWVEQAILNPFPLSGPQCEGRAATYTPPRDALALALMDNKPTEGIENYTEWLIDLKMLDMGTHFKEGKCGKVFGGSYKGEDVAIKILERPQNPFKNKFNNEELAHVVSKILEKEQSMAQQVQQEIRMLTQLKHPNIVGFIGACLKPKVWCIVTQYSELGSVKQQNRPVPLKLAVNQALDVARGMAYAHGLGIVHEDLNSYNILIFPDKSIKIAGFGEARIEEKTEETGTYRWMAP
ncbi:hypothetical protein HHK36_020035 [Tetracentron sinense]|uniref:Protein kinase domain-containing protein n=1 Tax=Tetracentron sinense TaxID=13715 RepID=A0A834YSW4_TETSI|nr:hypothetical protein HHK36_020035 [Tetracentron sinense]